VLFTGSVRSNLDPFGEHGDAALLAALRQVQLLGALGEGCGTGAGTGVEAEGGSSGEGGAGGEGGGAAIGLGSAVTEGGANFSAGQRQLLCLGRAVLRRSRVVLMDEATSAMDMTTDARLQATLNDAFRAQTVLVVAHRLETVLDSDFVLVMRGGGGGPRGRVEEFGPPAELLAKPGGEFRRMVGKSKEGAGGGGMEAAADC
jgi:ABC-type multidrug transport system fused ATPase/permease subunit